jgi:hypothetical protein
MIRRRAAAGGKPMKIYAADDRELMEIAEMVPAGGVLLLRGRIFGTMPVTAKLTPEELRAAVGLLGPRGILCLLSMLLRRRRVPAGGS